MLDESGSLFPVTCLVHLKATRETLDLISNHLCEILNFEPKARWNLICKLYRPGHAVTNRQGVSASEEDLMSESLLDKMDNSESLLCLLKSSHRPGKAWCAIFGDKKTAVVLASNSYNFEAIISKCKNLWFFRQNVIVSGKTYICGNYKIRSGVMNFGSAPKGIVLQAESSFCSSENFQNEISLLKDLLKQIVGRVTDLNTSELTFIPPDSHGTPTVNDRGDLIDDSESLHFSKKDNLMFGTSGTGEGCEHDLNSSPKESTSEYNPLSYTQQTTFTNRHEAYQIFSLIKTVIL